ncbi:MAG: ferritin-like domain-containing protein [Chitinophagaceae bacterium]
MKLPTGNFLKMYWETQRIGGLIVDFSSINFSSKDSVLATAKAFEDLGVSAYNGAGELLQSADYLLYAGKIVSVEARHAATLRDMISYGSFADSTAVNSMGLDLYRTPPEVLAIADQYILTNINSKNLPTS